MHLSIGPLLRCAARVPDPNHPRRDGCGALRSLLEPTMVGERLQHKSPLRGPTTADKPEKTLTTLFRPGPSRACTWGARVRAWTSDCSGSPRQAGEMKACMGGNKGNVAGTISPC